MADENEIKLKEKICDYLDTNGWRTARVSGSPVCRQRLPVAYHRSLAPPGRRARVGVAFTTSIGASAVFPPARRIWSWASAQLVTRGGSAPR